MSEADHRREDVWLAIDASAARVGGGASRVRELAATLCELAPQRRFAIAVSQHVVPTIPRMPPRTVLLRVPPSLSATWARLAWEHVYLPIRLRRERPEWLLSPFNILPLGPGLPRVRRAVIVSNIGPFAPEISTGATPFQKVRNLLLRNLTARSLAVADLVFLLSEEACRLLGSHLIGKTVVRLPMAPPPPDVLERARSRPPPAGAACDRPYVIMVGDVLPHKGHEDAVGAVGELRRRGVDLQLLVCGAPIDREYTRRTRSLAEAGATTTFLGPVPHEDVLALMRGAVATLMCSRIENPGRVPIEAMAVGSPLLVADVPALREHCGTAAEYYPVGQPLVLADAIERVLGDEAVRVDLVERGRRGLAGIDWLSATRVILETLESR